MILLKFINFKIFLKKRPFSKLLQELPLLICSAEPSRKSFAEQALLDADLIPSSIVTSDYPSTLLDLCHQGRGIGVFSQNSTQPLSGHGLKSLRSPQGAPKLQDTLFVMWATEAKNSEAVKLMQEVIGKEGPS